MGLDLLLPAPARGLEPCVALAAAGSVWVPDASPLLVADTVSAYLVLG